MDNILLVTELYPVPSEENVASKVCHFFAREWAKKGKRVVALHFQPVYCSLWYFAFRHLESIINSRMNGLFYRYPLKEIRSYDIDGVEVVRIPCFIPLPKGNFPKKSIDKFCRAAVSELNARGFNPEIIVGHLLPIEIIPALNANYGVKTCMVAHGEMPKLQKRYPDYKALINSYSGWGFRSEPIRAAFEDRHGKVDKSFICYSGIPQKYIPSSFSRTAVDVRKIVYVGDLIERKCPYELLVAVHRSFGRDFSLTYVGEGNERVRIEDYVRQNALSAQVTLAGKISRDEVVKVLDQKSVFAMMSRGEAFGLVYLEAMARGLLTIASKGEGMDGIIINGENGLLAEAGNTLGMAALLKKLSDMPQSELLSIAAAGYETSIKYSDALMADDYLSKLEML